MVCSVTRTLLSAGVLLYLSMDLPAEAAHDELAMLLSAGNGNATQDTVSTVSAVIQDRQVQDEERATEDARMTTGGRQGMIVGSQFELVELLTFPDNKYQKDRNTPLGKGAFGEVWSAKDKRTNGQVAVKLLFGDEVGAAGDEVRGCKFQNEMRQKAMAYKIPHPKVINNCVEEHIRECWTGSAWKPNCERYLVYEFAPGTELGKASREQLYLNKKEIFYQLMEGVYAMSVIDALYPELVHRDIKPPNVQVEFTANGPSATIIDFGLAVEGKPNDPRFMDFPYGWSPWYVSFSQDSVDKCEAKSSERYAYSPHDMWSIAALYYMMDNKLDEHTAHGRLHSYKCTFLRREHYSSFPQSACGTHLKEGMLVSAWVTKAGQSSDKVLQIVAKSLSPTACDRPLPTGWAQRK